MYVKKHGTLFFLLWTILLASMVSAFFAVPASAAAEKIDTVRLTFSYDEAPKAGEAVGTVTVKTTSKEFTVESAEYANDTDEWSMGDRPEVTVVLSAAQDFRFSYTSSSHFKLSGCGADFRKARIQDGGDRLTLEVYLKRVAGKVEEPVDLDWDGTKAMWSECEGAKEYDVQLYRGRTRVASVTTRNTTYNFRDKITKSGEYSFRVRGISRYDGKAGSWSDYSDTNTFTSISGTSGNRGSWMRNQTGWWYQYGNGDYLTDCWKNINNAWYYFNSDGYMLNGWQHINGSWYYLDANGIMYAGRHTPDGYYVNESGVWIP